MSNTIAAGALDATAGTVQAFGQFGAGRAQRAISNAQAKLMQAEADRALGVGAFERSKEQRKGSRAVASGRALLAARGVDPGAGSAALIADDIAGGSLLNQLFIGNQALARATDLRSRAAIAQFQGRFARDKALVDSNVTAMRTTASALRTFGGPTSSGVTS